MKRGDRVRKRGSDDQGVVLEAKDGCVSVAWDKGFFPRTRPRFCVEKELEAL